MKRFPFSKKIKVLLGLITAMLVCIFACKQNKEAPETRISKLVINEIENFSVLKNKFVNAVKNNASEKELRQLFLQTRLEYKKIEWATEYFTPLEARKINGAPVPEIESSEFPGSPPLVIQPDGLQIIEPLLFPKYNNADKDSLISRIQQLQDACDKMKGRFNNVSILNWQVFDATKLEVFRVITLGITGFDAPVSLNSVEEAASSLSGIKKTLANYPSEYSVNLFKTIDSAINYLTKNKNSFDNFDRATFITNYANAISTGIQKMQSDLQIQPLLYNRLLKQDAATLFDAGAFNINEYVASFGDSSTDDKIALGRQLFYDPILSKNKVRSCSSCHQQDKAFTDGLVRNTVINSTELLPRNTPTLLNAALQPALFYDSRAATLEDQVQQVVSNKNEMHSSLKEAAILLWNDKTYKVLFNKAYPGKDRIQILPDEIANALGSYLRSLVKLNSRFDEYMRGNKGIMTANEIHGFNIFMGKAKCATCHYMPLFNGNNPPKFMKIESEIIGVPQSTKLPAVIDTDMGRYNIVHNDFYKYAFKTPTLRNIAKTAPYMHNGVYKTLQEVMDFYNKGGGKGIGIALDNQTLPFDKLNLTQNEIEDVIAFLKTLDSK